MLPLSGLASLSEVATAIAAAPRELHVPEVVSIRTVLIRRGGVPEWVNFATVLHVGRSEDLTDDTPVIRDLRSIRLLAFERPTFIFADASSLRDVLIQWQHLLGRPEEMFPDSAVVYRETSRNPYTHREPCWRIELTGKTPGVGEVRLPDGPFLGTDSAFHARSVGEAAAKWLQDPRFMGANASTNQYRIIIPDRRGYFEGLRAEGNEVEVTVRQAAPGELHCAFVATDLDGDASEGILPVRDGKVTLNLVRSVRTLAIDLFNDEGHCLDRYEEGGLWASWGRSLFNEDRRRADPKYADLRRDLEQGEGEHCEFKPYIDLAPRRPKALELLESAAAFANARGGSIYIGVTDDAAVEGVDLAFPPAMRKKFKEDLAAMRDEYARLVRRVLSEGISPPVSLTVEWVSHAELWVLRIGITEGAQKPHAIVENSEIRIRRGASNRRPDRTELQQLFGKESRR